MVLILDGSLEIGAHALSKIDNLICVRHLFRWKAGTNMKSIFRKVQITFTRTQRELQFYHDFSLSHEQFQNIDECMYV